MSPIDDFNEDERSRLVAAEMERAAGVLISLVGEEMPTISIASDGPDDAIFLSQNISKLSPLIGNLIERRAARLLSLGSSEGTRWIRQDPGFPDALLIESNGQSLNAGYEIKAWYVLSTEITGRFRESVNLLRGKDVRLVIVAWTMSHVFYGTPQVAGICIIDAESVALTRDSHYHSPPGYVLMEPQDTSERTANLRQSNVGGFKLQDTTPETLEVLRQLMVRHVGVNALSHEESANTLVRELMNAAEYRGDTNFAKIDRINHPEIEAFKTTMLNQENKGRPNRGWIRLIDALSLQESAPRRIEAEAVVNDIYGVL